jgi:pimeloyl-ACP methyl ester carboxylesterase
MYTGYKNMKRSSADLVQKSVQVADYSMVYLEGGKGETLVLIHGFGAEKDHWTLMAKYLSDKYHLIIPDLPGFGESVKRDDMSYDVESQADRIHYFLKKLNAGKVFIAGNSMGGNISGIFAAKYPDEVAGLILLDTAGIIAPEKSDLTKSLEAGINPLIVNSTEDYDRLMEYGFVKPPYIPGPVKRILAEQAIKNKTYNEKVWSDMNRKPVLLQDRLSKLKMPVLILWGDKDRIINVSCVQVLEKNLKNFRTHILKDCGHAPMVERPGETAGYIKDFLQTM